MEREETEFDKALLSGAINVDEYATTLVREVDAKNRDPISHAQYQKERQVLLEKAAQILRTARSSYLAKQAFTAWKLAVEVKKNEQCQREFSQQNQELESIKLQNTSLSRQKRELNVRMSELNDRRTHSLDVSDLAEQVRELTQELGKVKAENAALVAKTEPMMVLRSRRVPLIPVENAGPTKQNEGVGKMVREYQAKVQRLEEELSNEKLKRANESARRLEKENEGVKYKRELDDAKAEIVSLQLRLARMEATAAEKGFQLTKPRASFLVPQTTAMTAIKPPSLDEETFTSRIADYHEVTDSNTLSSSAPRKSFFRPAGAAAMTRKPGMPALNEETTASPSAAGENCAQQ